MALREMAFFGDARWWRNVLAPGLALVAGWLVVFALRPLERGRERGVREGKGTRGKTGVAGESGARAGSGLGETGWQEVVEVLRRQPRMAVEADLQTLKAWLERAGDSETLLQVEQVLNWLEEASEEEAFALFERVGECAVSERVRHLMVRRLAGQGAASGRRERMEKMLCDVVDRDLHGGMTMEALRGLIYFRSDTQPGWAEEKASHLALCPESAAEERLEALQLLSEAGSGVTEAACRCVLLQGANVREQTVAFEILGVEGTLETLLWMGRLPEFREPAIAEARERAMQRLRARLGPVKGASVP